MAPAFELRSLFDSCREPRATKCDRHNVGEFTRQWDSYDQRELDLMTFPSAPSSPKQIEDLNPKEPPLSARDSQGLRLGFRGIPAPVIRGNVR